MSIWDLDLSEVREHYDERVHVHKQLIGLHEQGVRSKFAYLALGIKNQAGNYSAAEHGLGPKIIGLNNNAENLVFALAKEFLSLEDPKSVPALVRKAAIKYLSIGVGSELSCMVSPNLCWVANTRTIWVHLLVKHNDSLIKADEELNLYRQTDETSEMAYKKWSEIHSQVDLSLRTVAGKYLPQCSNVGIRSGEITYLWADALASFLYDKHHA